MAFPTFEHWKAPWEDKDEEFDADVAKKLIYNMSKRASERDAARETEKTEAAAKISELEAKVQEFEDKDLSEVERLRKENERLKTPKTPDDKGNDSLAQARLEIALEKGLTLAQSKRLAGSTREELEADAVAYKAELGGTGAGDGADDGDDDGNEQNDLQQDRSDAPLRGGFNSRGAGIEQFDPDKMAEAVGRY